MSKAWVFFRQWIPTIWKFASFTFTLSLPPPCSSFSQAEVIAVLTYTELFRSSWLPGLCRRKVTSVAQLSLLLCSALVFLTSTPGWTPRTQRALPTIIFLHLKWAHCLHFQDHRFQKRQMKPFPRTWNHICALESPIRLLAVSSVVSLLLFCLLCNRRNVETSTVRGGSCPGDKGLQQRGTSWKRVKLWEAPPGYRHPAWDIFYKSLV